MNHLRVIWEKSNKTTLVTKFEQDVLESLKRLPLSYRENSNEPDTGLECDLLITKYKGNPVKVAVEVNGVFHFSRNSEEPLGKDILKRRTLESKGHKVMVVSYYEWCILEDAQKSAFLKDVLENCILK